MLPVCCIKAKSVSRVIKDLWPLKKVLCIVSPLFGMFFKQHRPGIGAYSTGAGIGAHSTRARIGADSTVPGIGVGSTEARIDADSIRTDFV